MKLRFLFAILLLAGFMATQAQQKELARLVAQKKQAGVTFRSISPFTENSSPTAMRQQAAQDINKFSLFNINQTQLRSTVNDKPEALSMKLSTAQEGDFELELVKVELFTPDFKVTTSDNQTFTGFNNQVHYRGVVKGVDRSVTAISISGDQVMGVISMPNSGNLILGPMEGLNPDKQHVLYRDQDIRNRPLTDCKTPDDPAIRYTQNQLSGNPLAHGQGASCVRIYVETDYNIFVNRGSVANVVTFINGLFNQSAMLYQNEGIFTTLSQVFVWTGASPYNPTNTATYLASFQGFRNTFNGDLGHLVGFYNIGGQAAGFTGLCNTNRDFDQCVSGLTGPTYPTIPTYSFNVEVFTHEMGHLLGSRHTHACVWNGNNTAIDGCAGFVEGSCPLPGIPAGGGTIMSYCHITSVGINFTLGFGTQPSNVIRNRVFAATCLNACSPQPTVDLYIQDKPTDNGTEPNPDPSGQWWVSQDIWIRNNNDGGTVHQNPRGGFTNYVYVRVRNRGNMQSFSMSNVRLRTYWAKASGSLSWTSPWTGGTACSPAVQMGNPIGTSQIPNVAANGSIVMVFPWSAPTPSTYNACFGADRFHFCLLARIETTNYSPFGMTFPETTNLGLNVKNNNNIAWKNVSVTNPNGTFTRVNPFANEVNPDDVGDVAFVLNPEELKAQDITTFNLDFNYERKRDVPSYVALKPTRPSETPDDGEEGPNPWEIRTNSSLSNTVNQATAEDAEGMTYFEDPAQIPYHAINVNYSVWDYAYVDIDLGKNLFRGWSGTGAEFKVLDEIAPSGVNWIRMMRPKSSLDKISFPGTKDVEIVRVRITQIKAATDGETDFDLDVTVTNYSTKRETVGGETFAVTLGREETGRTLSSARTAGSVSSGGAMEETVFLPSNTAKRVDVIAAIPADQYEATLFDMSGKLVRRKIFTGKTNIETNGLSRGMYMATLVNLRTRVVTKHKIFLE